MLSPRKVRHRKTMKRLRRFKGTTTRGAALNFGQFGLKALEPGWVTARQIEAARVAITRRVKRGGKLWIRIFPDHPLTKKPAEVRMGKGKGSPELWVADVEAGRIMYEMTGVDEAIARKALALAAAKLPLKTSIIKRSQNLL